jgi:integrase
MIPRTVNELVELWPTVAAGLGDRDQDTIAHTLGMARRFERSFGRRLLETLTTPEMASWAVRWPSHARYARTLLNDAVKLGALAASPFDGVTIPRVDGREEYVPTWAEAMALVDAGWRVGLGGMPLLAACTGGRVGALCKLQVAELDLAGGRVELKRKGRKGTYTGLVVEPARSSARLAAALPDVGLAFTTPTLGREWNRQSVSKKWVLARREVGLPEGCTFHALRKAFATHLLDQGKSRADVAFALDHVDATGRPQTEQVDRVYGRPSREAALARLEAA